MFWTKIKCSSFVLNIDGVQNLEFFRIIVKNKTMINFFHMIKSFKLFMVAFSQMSSFCRTYYFNGNCLSSSFPPSWQKFQNFAMIVKWHELARIEENLTEKYLTGLSIVSITL